MYTDVAKEGAVASVNKKSQVLCIGTIGKMPEISKAVAITDFWGKIISEDNLRVPCPCRTTESMVSPGFISSCSAGKVLMDCCSHGSSGSRCCLLWMETFASSWVWFCRHEECKNHVVTDASTKISKESLEVRQCMAAFSEATHREAQEWSWSCNGDPKKIDVQQHAAHAEGSCRQHEKPLQEKG